jgi:alpha-tubulin suppressor-like RCC1 family protein
MCLGDNSSGQCGRSKGNSAYTDLQPALTAPGKPVMSLFGGDEVQCVLYNDSSVSCWGWNGYGQLGQGDTVDRGWQAGDMGANLPFVALGSGVSVQYVSIGDTHVCALTSTRLVKCWGYNHEGELGQGFLSNSNTGVGTSGNQMVGGAVPGCEQASGLTAPRTRATGGPAAVCQLGHQRDGRRAERGWICKF